MVSCFLQKFFYDIFFTRGHIVIVAKALALSGEDILFGAPPGVSAGEDILFRTLRTSNRAYASQQPRTHAWGARLWRHFNVITSRNLDEYK